MRNLSRADGFTITEMMVSTAVVLMVMGGALTTFRNALNINDSASQLADANQNLRAGTNQLIRDLLMAGRMIGTEGIAMPTGTGITFARPGPVPMNFPEAADGDATMQLPSITTGFGLGPKIPSTCTACLATDMITILTIDEFMPIVTTPVTTANSPTQATISADGTYVTFAATSQWIDGDTVNDTPKIKVGDLVYYMGTAGNAIQTVTSIDTALHRIYFNQGDFFRFNQPNATDPPTTCPCTSARPLGAMKGLPATSAWAQPVSLFKALMITYYVDNTTTPGTPRLTRVLNNFAPQALAGVVEDLDITYDLYDGSVNPTGVTFLPQTISGVGFTANQIRKVNLHVGVRSETISNPTRDYVRNHISTSVNVRSLAAVDKYPS